MRRSNPRRGRRAAAALAFALTMGGCEDGGPADPEPVFSELRDAKRVVFNPRGPYLDITYLSCRGESIPGIRVVQTDTGDEVSWQVLLEEYFGSPRTNVTAYFLVRPHGEAYRERHRLPPPEESHLEVTVLADDPIVVTNLEISELPSDKLTLATGEEVENLDLQEWESKRSRYEEERGCRD